MCCLQLLGARAVHVEMIMQSCYWAFARFERRSLFSTFFISFELGVGRCSRTHGTVRNAISYIGSAMDLKFEYDSSEGSIQSDPLCCLAGPSMHTSHQSATLWAFFSMSKNAALKKAYLEKINEACNGSLRASAPRASHRCMH